MPHPRGTRIDLAATARAARRTFGETLRLMQKTRPQKPRRLLFLIDVSGSMKAQSEIICASRICVSHRLPRVETFCFGTRLSRVTEDAVAPRPAIALERLADTVFDFDGGTLIGASLRNFCRCPACRAGARRRHHRLFGRAGARRSAADGPRRRTPGAAQPPPRLGDAAGRRSALSPGNARHGRHPAVSRRSRRRLEPAGARAQVARLDAVERMGRGQAGQRFAERRKAA